MNEFSANMIDLLDASPSPYHAVAAMATRLDEAGFERLAESARWTLGQVEQPAYVVRGGTLIAWHGASHHSLANGVRLVGAHSDSPNLRIKPQPDTGGFGYQQLGIEIYGSPLINSWLDRDLGVAGRVALRSGETALVRVDRPLMRIPQLAIHLDRNVNDGLALDKQSHLTPVWAMGTPNAGDFNDFVASEIGVPATDILAFDLMTFDLTQATALGRSGEFITSARIDNLNSCSCALDALLGTVPVNHMAMLAVFDHEEVGSESTTGAMGAMLHAVLQRIAIVVAPGDPQALHRALANGFCVSADAAHAVHPNYAERHDPNHRPVLNGGPVVKVNANQRYASDAETVAEFIRACDASGVPHQTFVSRNTMPCGSTIGPITSARLGIPTVDVGNPMLSMHSAHEMCGVDDAAMMVTALTHILSAG